MSSSGLTHELKDEGAKAKAEVKALRRTPIGGWFTILFHFVVTQCRPIYTFYFSYKAYLIMFISYEVQNIIVTNPIEVAARRPTDMRFAEYTNCVALDAQALMSTWTTPMKTECIGTIGNEFFGFATTNRVYTGLNWLCEALCAVFVLIMVVALFKSGAKHVGHGRYIAFTWRVENSLAHRICSVTLIVVCVLMLADFVRFVVAQYLEGTLMDQVPFVMSIVPALGGLIGAATSLYKPSDIPTFDWESEAFTELHMFRKVTKISLNNEDFYNGVVKAVHASELGHPALLEEVGPGGDYSTPQHIAAGIQPKDKYSPIPTNEPSR